MEDPGIRQGILNNVDEEAELVNEAKSATMIIAQNTTLQPVNLSQ
jgi:hypothetical protein